MFKSSLSSIYTPDAPDGLAEVLDRNRRPLCLLSSDEVLRQGLLHRQIAVLAVAAPDLALLAEKGEALFDVTVQAPLQAGIAASDFAESLLIRSLGHKAAVREIATLEVFPTIISIFIAQFSASLLKAILSSHFLLSSWSEVQQLAERGMMAPLPKKIFSLLSP